MYYPFCSRGSHWIFCYVLLQQCFILICQFLLILPEKRKMSVQYVLFSPDQCMLDNFHDHLLRNFSNHQKLFSEIQSTISDSEHYPTNANPHMIMKTDILDYKNCTCIMISKKVQTFIFNPPLLFFRFRFAHKAMRKKKKKKKKKIIILSILLFKISFDIAYFGS